VIEDVAILDSDTLSQVSRGQPAVVARARAYLSRRGRFTVTAVSVFERLRGYRAAIRSELQLRQFEAFVAPLDATAADLAAGIRAALGSRARRAVGDIWIAAIAAVHRSSPATDATSSPLPGSTSSACASWTGPGNAALSRQLSILTRLVEQIS
jgi:predicted nucleic acid-binding protein